MLAAQTSALETEGVNDTTDADLDATSATAPTAHPADVTLPPARPQRTPLRAHDLNAFVLP